MKNHNYCFLIKNCLVSFMFVLCGCGHLIPDSSYGISDFEIELCNQHSDSIHALGITWTNKTSDIKPYHFFLQEYQHLHANPAAGDTKGLIGFYEPMEYKGKKFYVIIYKQETLEKYSKQEIIEDGIYDAKYAFTYDELRAMDFKIVYTGR